MTNEKKFKRLFAMANRVSIPGKIAVVISTETSPLFKGKYQVYIDSAKGRNVWHGLSMPKASKILDSICTTIDIMK